MAARTISFTLNGEPVSAEIDAHHTILEVIRNEFALYGARTRIATRGRIKIARLCPPYKGTPLFSLSARNTDSGVSGNSVRRTPTASSMAFAIAGDTANVADSPAPLAPNGPLC